MIIISKDLPDFVQGSSQCPASVWDSHDSKNKNSKEREETNSPALKLVRHSAWPSNPWVTGVKCRVIQSDHHENHLDLHKENLDHLFFIVGLWSVVLFLFQRSTRFLDCFAVRLLSIELYYNDFWYQKHNWPCIFSIYWPTGLPNLIISCLEYDGW